MIERARKRLDKKAKKGFRGWPLATVALYGPDDRPATKFSVGIVPAEDADEDPRQIASHTNRLSSCCRAEPSDGYGPLA